MIFTQLEDFNAEGITHQRLNTDSLTVTSYDPSTGKEDLIQDFSENKLARLYLRWAEEYVPQRLQTEVDKGEIVSHIRGKVADCNTQRNYTWKHFIDTDEEYLRAVDNADTLKVWQLQNYLELQAEEIAIREVLFC